MEVEKAGGEDGSPTPMCVCAGEVFQVIEWNFELEVLSSCSPRCCARQHRQTSRALHSSPLALQSLRVHIRCRCTHKILCTCDRSDRSGHRLQWLRLLDSCSCAAVASNDLHNAIAAGPLDDRQAINVERTCSHACRLLKLLFVGNRMPAVDQAVCTSCECSAKYYLSNHTFVTLTAKTCQVDRHCTLLRWPLHVQSAAAYLHAGSFFRLERRAAPRTSLSCDGVDHGESISATLVMPMSSSC